MHAPIYFTRCAVAGVLAGLLSSLAFGREAGTMLPLWPGQPPGETSARGEEHKVEGRPRPFYQLTDITTPTLVVFHAPAEKRNGTAVLVCPGGGMQRLAYEHEGLEAAEWLNSLGLTACVLKYRVPSPAQTAAMDAQRALSLMRSHAAEWKLDSDAIGTLGFSAGGEIGAWLLTHHDRRLYPVIDAADHVSCRPDFVALVYSGGLLHRDGTVKEPLASRLQAGLPPVFLAHAFDDSSQESLTFALALKRASVPTELHLYREGGHGFGVRSTGIPTSSWKEVFADWLGSLGFLDRAPLRDLARRTDVAVAAGQSPPRFTDSLPDASLDDAYVAQRRLVRARAGADPIAGFKVAAASSAAQSSLGVDGPLAGVVFRSGRLDGRERQVISLRDGESVAVETEVGYLTSVDLSYEILNDEQVRGAVESVVPIIELPRSFPNSGPANARNMVAANVGSDRFIVGPPVKAERFNPDAVAITLKRDDQVLHETTGATVAGGQWHNLRLALNALTRHGYTIPAGSVILGGALGKIQPGEKGSYEANFGELGTIAFELR
ncbi:MAG TPA: alpha/beta hydrolase fold domain-containing protein [Verrucomicrobiota bacterium]|nr:alpha/beta hydrolase fold domain-containing protein [Verrucomicrobiota bacterium]